MQAWVVAGRADPIYRLPISASPTACQGRQGARWLVFAAMMQRKLSRDALGEGAVAAANDSIKVKRAHPCGPGHPTKDKLLATIDAIELTKKLP